MSFTYQNQVLHAESVPLTTIAEQYGTPSYVYSRTAIETQWRAYDDAFGDRRHRICYAVKANSNLAVLSVLAKLGSGFDIVSVGELMRVLKAGGDPQNIVFSGVGKRADELQTALEIGIGCFNVESAAELFQLAEIAGKLGKSAPISLRVNPDVDAQTHPYISTGLKENKFGISIDEAVDLYRHAATDSRLQLVGVDCHIGSQLTTLSPFIDAVKRIRSLVDTLLREKIILQHIDLGGGLGIRYGEETPPSPAEHIQALLTAWGNDDDRAIWIEPGRAIVGNAGVLLVKVELLKMNGDKHFAVVDGGMNDLLRPSLYGAWQDISSVVLRQPDSRPYRTFDIVGPICETGDFLGKNRELCLEAGDLLVVRGAGAYGFVMSSQYNSRPRAAELLVEGDRIWVARRRETLDDLFALEAPL